MAIRLIVFTYQFINRYQDPQKLGQALYPPLKKPTKTVKLCGQMGVLQKAEYGAVRFKRQGPLPRARLAYPVLLTGPFPHLLEWV